MPVVQSGEDTIEFPDSMSQADIETVLRNHYSGQAIDYALKAPTEATGTLIKTLESGAEGADMGRRQAEKERIAQEMQRTRIAGASGRGQEQLLGGLENTAGFVAQMEPLNLLKRTLEIPAQLSGSPYKIQPLVSPETVRKGIDLFDPTVSQAGSVSEGVKQFAAELGSGLTSPDQVAALAAGKVAPALVARQFQVSVASQIPESTKQLAEAVKSGDLTAVGKSAASLAAAVAIPTAIEKGLAKVPEKGPKPELTTPEPPTPEVVKTEGAPSEVPGVPPPEAPSAVAANEVRPVAAGSPEPAIAESKPVEQVKQVGSVTESVTEPQIQGMGGAIPSEFDRKGSPTAMKYAKIDEERQQRGLEPLTKPEGTTDQATLDKAMAAIDQDPSLPDKLVAELNEKPRAIEDWENHVLMLRKVDLRNEYEKSANESAQAYDDAKQFPDRLADMQRANLRTAELSDQLDALERASRVSGSARGRALRSLQVMLNEDYSLAGLERQKRAAKGGAPLTPDERAELVRVSKELQSSQKALADYQATEAQRRVDAVKKAIEEDQKKRPYVSPPILNIAQQLVSTIDTRADAARARLRERAGRFSAGVDPTILVDLAEIGMSHIAHAGLDFAEWSARMVSDVGDWVKPHLEEVFKRSQDGIDSLAETVKAPKEAVKKAVKGGFKGLDIEGKKKETVRAVKKAQENKEDIGYYAQRIARAFVQEGVENTDQLIDAVHSVLKEAIPDIDRRTVMDAISGYGDYKQLSKDQITVKLRGMKGEMQQLAKLEDMAKGQPPLKSGVERRTPTEAEKNLIREVNEAKRKFQIPISDPNTQLRSALDTLKASLETRIKRYEERLASGDFTTKPKRPIEMDRRAQELTIKAEKIKRKFKEALVQDRLKQRHWWEKALDWGTNYRRFGVLTSPIVLPKLISAGVQRLASLPIEELAGSVLKRLPGVKRVSELAPIEGGGANVKAELKGYGAAFTQGMRDAYNTIKEGHSDLDVIYGKREYTPAGEFDLGNAILSFPGRLHGMLKAPIKRAVFERSVQRLGEFYSKQGLDVTDPLVKIRIGTEAYKAANAAIFLQNNFIASKLNAWLAPKIDKSTGHPTVGSKVWQTAGRVALPITRVPINIVAEAMQYAFGLVTGGTRLAAAMAKGVEKLTPEQADLIMRELKKGSVGGAALLLGYFNPDAVGGYYQKGQKRPQEDIKAGHIKLAGVDIPSWLLHNPLLETVQIGATIRRVADHIPSNKTEPEGLGFGALAGALGVTEQIPFVKEQEVVGRVLGSAGERHAALGELARDIAVPQALQFVAKQMDMTEEGPLKRRTENIKDYLKSGVPILRQQLEPK